MKTLSLAFSESAFSALRLTPEDFAKELRLAAAVKWYEQERISQSKAAEVAGLSRAELIDALSRYGVSAVQTKPEELGSDVRHALGRNPTPADGPDA